MNVKKTEISILIPTFKRRKYISRLIEDILNQNLERKYEILVLDNECNSEIENDLLNFKNKEVIRYIPVPQLGLHNCRNLGTYESYGHIIVFIDDDVIVPPHWLSALCKPFSNESVAGVGGKILPKWEGMKPDWIDSVNTSYFSLLDMGNSDREMQWPETPFGCNMAYRSEVIKDLGGFSPDSIGNSFIDWKRGDGETGFAKKIYDKGLSIYYSADGYLYHRIPPERMTKKYLRKMAVRNSITSFYMRMRVNRYSSFSLLKIVLKNIYLLIKTLLKNTGRIVKNKTDINFQFSVVHYLISIMYHIKLMFDPDLRKWVIQDNYLNNIAIDNRKDNP